jgi:hypothetical protein
MPIVLPTEKRIATERNARFLVAFGKPKSGKTTAISMLDNCLLIDINNGSDYVDGLVVKASNLRELKAIAVAIKEAGCPYEKIALDTATDLEDMVNELAIFKYKQTPMGKNYGKNPGEDDIKKLPNGAGYLYLREAFKDALDWFKPLCKYFILLGHCSDRLINKDGKELSEMEIDLSGKLKRIVAGDADALGYIYRDKNKTMITFNGGGDSVVEARPAHLKGREFVLLESNEDGNISHNWDEIFLK